MTQRVGIIGIGWVGASVAMATLQAGAADELLLADAREGLAEGEAMDLAHGASFYPRARVRAASVAEMRRCDAVVVAAGRGGKPGESRLALLQDNAALVRGIGRELVGGAEGFGGCIVMVTNPVDVLTQVMAEATGLPAARVIGTGTMLDTARLRQALGQALHIDLRSIHAQVVGEHGDSQVPLWSHAQVGGVPLRDWPGWSHEREAALALQVRRAAYEIIQRKGATNHAIGVVTANLLRALLHDERRVLTVSRLQQGAAGVDGTALSLPAVVGAGGAVEVMAPAMDEAERVALAHSAETLRQAFASVSP